MCLIIDVNCFGCVFNPESREHARFVPVLNWVMRGWGGRLIYGGTKYKREIGVSRGYVAILAELEKKGRLVRIPDRQVDRIAKDLKKRVNDPDFDDEDLLALVTASKCCVICTDDKRAFPFLRRAALYPDGVHPPKIYQNRTHAHLCDAGHVVAVCETDKASR